MRSGLETDASLSAGDDARFRILSSPSTCGFSCVSPAPSRGRARGSIGKLPGSELGREVGVDLAAAADLNDPGCAPLLHARLLVRAPADRRRTAHVNAPSIPKVRSVAIAPSPEVARPPRHRNAEKSLGRERRRRRVRPTTARDKPQCLAAVDRLARSGSRKRVALIATCRGRPQG